MLIGEALAGFLEDLGLAHAPSTVVSYRFGLHRFAEYLDARDRLPADVGGLDVDQVVDYCRWLMAVPPAGSSRRTCDTYVVALTTFYGWLVREGIRPELELVRLRLRLRPLLGRRPSRLPRVPSDAVVDRILAAAAAHRPRSGGELTRLRNVAMLETLRGSGLRVSELCRLRRVDLLGRERTAIVPGKGSKERVAYFSAAAWAAIAAYLGARGDETPNAPVFCPHDGAGRLRPIRPGTVRDAIDTLGKLAGLGELRVTPHRFRAWFATHVLDQTGDLAATQDLLGHESPNTTRQYARVADRRLREIHERAFASAV